jgi:hypothetical protein
MESKLSDPIEELDPIERNIATYRQFMSNNHLEGIQYTSISFSIRHVIMDIENGTWIIAPYQRNYVYDRNRYRKASKVIETIILGRIIPPIIVQLNNETSVLEIVDGQQRIKSIQKFTSNQFKLNLSDDDDELTMLHGLRFRDLPIDIKNRIWNYELTAFKLINDSIDFAVRVFLDINTQPVPVGKPNIILNLCYGFLMEQVQELLSLRNERYPNYEHIWRIFGGQLNKNGSIKLTHFNKSGEVNLRVFKTMASFVDSTINLKELSDLRMLSAQCDSLEALKRHKLNRFNEISEIIDGVFHLGDPLSPKSEHPFMGLVPKKRVPGMRLDFVEPLIDILYLGLKEVIDEYQQFIRDQDGYQLNVKLRETYGQIKQEVLAGDLTNYTFLNLKKEKFIGIIKEIVHNE